MAAKAADDNVEVSAPDQSPTIAATVLPLAGLAMRTDLPHKGERGPVLFHRVLLKPKIKSSSLCCLE
jgi:hypothetical protein